MKITVLSGSKMGTKTRTTMNYVVDQFKKQYPNENVELIDLAEYDVVFSDGRNYREYEGDTKYVAETIMEADILVIGTPIFQGSIPGSLKNIFDLLPEKAFREKVVSIIVTAGSAKHYLIPETQLKPILHYMKAQIVQTYVFVEGSDLYRNEIISDDVMFRIERLIEDTMILTETYQEILKAKEEAYGF